MIRRIAGPAPALLMSLPATAVTPDRADGCEEGLSGDTLLFDPETGTFATTGALLQARAAHRAVPLKDGRMRILGGYAPSIRVDRGVRMFE